MTRIYLSHFLGPATPFYGANGNFTTEAISSMTNGDVCNSSRWSFPNHAGTHVDLPRHFFANGKCLSDYPPDWWFFSDIATLVMPDLPPGMVIGPELFTSLTAAPSTELLLLKTGLGRFRSGSTYWQKNPVFLPELAPFFRERFPCLRAFGFDTISVSSWTDRSTGREAHRAFLDGERPILLIEDMNLARLRESEKLAVVTVMPLLVEGADAAPCTVIGEVMEQ